MKTKVVEGYEFVQYERKTFPPAEMVTRSTEFYQWMDQRRTVRDFSDREIPKEVIDNLVRAASTAPSGAHKQPWTFCIVHDAALKKQIREAAEKEEYESYHSRMPDEWLAALRPLQTDWHKSFLETAPYLIIVFKRLYDVDREGKKRNNYYVSESVGLACGFLLAAVHQAGLVALTHTPSPMGFLTKILGRPENERPFLLIPVGYPAAEVYVPRLRRKPLEEVSVFY